MVLRLFRRRGNRALIDKLHGEIVSAARRPELFANFGVADSFEGRFEMTILHAALALRALRRLEAPGPEIAQDLVDSVFGHFDIALREMGVGDLSVPKRMKKLAEAFFGRSAAYDSALQQSSDAPLAASLARNVFAAGSTHDADARAAALAVYVRATEAALGGVTLVDVLSGTLRFAQPTPAMDAVS